MSPVVSQTDEYLESMKKVEALTQFTESGHVYTIPKANLNDGASAEYAISVVKYVYKEAVIV